MTPTDKGFPRGRAFLGSMSAVAIALTQLFAVAPAEAAGAPQIGPAWTSGVSASSAGLRAEVNPNGLATTYHFSYIAETGFLANLKEGKSGFAGSAKAPAGADPAIGSGSTNVTVAQTLPGLSADTSYRYRVEAANGAGTETGSTHSFVTESFAGAPLLLDGRGWEMVSPVDKNGGEIGPPGASFGGGVLQAAATGDAFTFSSTSSFGEDAQGAPPASQYIARRGPMAWGSENVTVPGFAGAYGDDPDGAPYQLFSPDLGRGLLFEGRRCGEGESCPVGYSLRESAGGALAASPGEPDLRLAGSAPDLGHVVLATCAALTPDATEVPSGGGCDPAETNLYEWSGAGLGLVNLLPAAAQGTPGARLAAQAGAISADGSRVYWTLGGNLYLREAATSRQLDASLGGGGTFETATPDGSVAFFTKGGHLYRYEAEGGTVVDLTPAGGAQGVLGASDDGSYLYYVTGAGLFLRHDAVVVKVADAADATDYPPATGTARVTPDGVHLAFLSKAGLGGYDNRNVATGLPESEVFLYDAATATLACASCDPTGERPRGPATIPGAIANGKGPWATDSYKPRNLSVDGRRIFFDSPDALALQDTDNRPDAYEWEAQGAGSCQRAGGCIGLISLGRSSEGASFLDASASGADAFFLTADSLVAADTGFGDIYDARVAGGFPEPPKPIECVGDSCQSLPSEPEDPTPGTLVPNSGNPPLRFPTAGACRRGFVRRHGRCVRKAKHGGKHRRGHG